jgi:hypothetical protein
MSSEMAVNLSALPSGRSLPPKISVVLISVRGGVVMRLEGLDQLKTLKNPVASILIELRGLPTASVV